jgi:hypothetical protein
MLWQNEESPVVLDNVGARLAVATKTLAELTNKYVLETVTPDAILMKDPTVPYLDPGRKPGMGEIGTTGHSNYSQLIREDYNSDLRGIQGIRLYDRMRKSDGQVRSTLRLVKTPVMAARWYVEPGGDRLKDQKIAKEIEQNLFNWMTMSWPQLLTEILLMLDFGYYMFEKVYAVKDGKIIWKKFAPRHPLDVMQWHFDDHGGPTAAEFFPLEGAAGPFIIPIEKLAVFSFDKEAGNIHGVSVLRSAYKHWYMKENLYKIDAIQKERHGLGIPVIVLPPGFTPEDRNLADEIGSNLRTNEKAHIVLPPKWELYMLKMEGQPVDALKSAEHHNTMINTNILGGFMEPGSGKATDNQLDMFLKATRYIADIIRDVFNKYCIPQIVYWNYGEQEVYPELRVRRIGDTVDWRTISFALRNFVGSGIIVPDDDLEKWIRDEMDLPNADPATARIIVAPQAPGTIPDGAPDGRPGPGGPSATAAHQNGGQGNKATPPGTGGGGIGKAGLPRQSTAAGSTQGKTPGGKQTGADKSGG